MYNPCYDLDIQIDQKFIDRVHEIFEIELPNARSDRAPDVRRENYPELWEPLGELADWFSPVVRILNHEPSKLGTTAIHLDVNEHEQYEQDRYVIIQGALNIPLFDSIGIQTSWWRQKNPDDIHPYDFWYDKGYEMEKIYSHEIKQPVLFRTGIWHSVEQSMEKRPMLSFSTKYTVDWDTIVSVAASKGLVPDLKQTANQTDLGVHLNMALPNESLQLSLPLDDFDEAV